MICFDFAYRCLVVVSRVDLIRPPSPCLAGSLLDPSAQRPPPAPCFSSGIQPANPMAPSTGPTTVPSVNGSQRSSPRTRYVLHLCAEVLDHFREWLPSQRGTTPRKALPVASGSSNCFISLTGNPDHRFHVRMTFHDPVTASNHYLRPMNACHPNPGEGIREPNDEYRRTSE